MYIEKEARERGAGEQGGRGEKQRSVFRAILVVKITKYLSLLPHLPLLPAPFPLPLD